MDAIRNYDGLYEYSSTVSYNNVLSVEVVTDVVAEPVTLAEIKAHLQIDYTDKDTILTRLGKVARIQIEKELGVALAPKTIKAQLRNELGNALLPYSPITSIVELTDNEGDVVSTNNYIIENGVLQTPFSTVVFVEYEVGYETCPEDYKQMILERVAYLDKERGDSEKNTSNRRWIL